MKNKIIPIVLFLFLSSLLPFFSCNKESIIINEMVENRLQDISNDIDFISFNDGVNRIDPLYIKIVFKDPREVHEIANESALLLNSLSKDPQNQLITQKLLDLYRLKSLQELKNLSKQINNSLNALEEKFQISIKSRLNNSGNWYFNNRKQYAKNKLLNSKFENLIRNQSSNIVSNSLDGTYLDNDDYYRVITEDAEADPEYSGGAGDIDKCREICRYRRLECLDNVYSKYLNNIALFVGPGALATGVAAVKVGSFFGIWGPVVGGIDGGLFGGVAGFVMASNIYVSDKSACNNSYQASVLQCP